MPSAQVANGYMLLLLQVTACNSSAYYNARHLIKTMSQYLS